MTTYRQGDVFIEKIDSIPGRAKPVERDNGRVVLAYGEVTGHAHAFLGKGVRMFRDDGTNGGAYIQVDGPSALTHEEHSAITIPAGAYKVTRQLEYTPQAIRQVAD